MFKGGKEEAAKMLNLLGGQAAKDLLEQIRQKDPILANELEDMLVRIEDLRHLTDNMKVTLLRDIDLELFGQALRTVDKDIVAEILKGLSSGIILDIEEGLKGKPIPLSKAQEAQDKVLELVREKIDKGQIVIKDDDEYV